jgi:hypothetical protein
LGEPLRAQKKHAKACFFCGLRRAIRSITFAGFARFGGSAAIPLAENAQTQNKKSLYIWRIARYFVVSHMVYYK